MTGYRQTATLAAVLAATENVERHRKVHRPPTLPAWERFGIVHHHTNN